MVLCECGCGQETVIYNGNPRRFIHGHNRRGVKTSDETKLKMSDVHKTRAPEQKAARSKAALAPKTPLPDGWQSKLSDITDNKLSPGYLGSIAETILANIYDNVQVMPPCNHGYDIICNKNFMIDIKASATGDKGFWRFAIFKNVIADFFLCIAFESRDDLFNPVHLWMIPGRDVNHASSISISKSTINKWQQYELSLDKLLMCCNNLKV